MKSRKIVASTVALLVLFVTTLWFVGCENGTGGKATTPEGGGIPGSGTGPNEVTLSFRDYEKEGTHDSLEFTNKFRKSGDYSLPFLSKKAIKVALEDTAYTRVSGNGDTGEGYMNKKPVFSGNYFIGEPKADVIELSLRRANVIRRLAGIRPLILDVETSKMAQHAAWVMAKDNTSGHDIDRFKKESISDTMWNTIKEALTWSALILRPRGAGGVDIFMGDNANPGLGHRLVVLDTIHTRKVGFGVASGNAGFGATTMMIKQEGGTVPENIHHNGSQSEWRLVAWPPAGYFPADTLLFDSNADRHRWSVLLNNKWSAIQDSTNVIVTKKIDGKEVCKWDFNKIMENKKTPNYSLKENETGGEIKYGDKEGNYAQPTIFHLTYGKKNPDGTVSEVNEDFVDGAQYTVRFENLSGGISGAASDPIEYTVEFFDLNKVE